MHDQSFDGDGKRFIRGGWLYGFTDNTSAVFPCAFVGMAFRWLRRTPWRF